MKPYTHNHLFHSDMMQSIAQNLRYDIISRKLKPGGRVTEQFLCEHYGTSRSTIRSILQELEKEGLVRIREHGCKEILPFTKKDVQNLYDFRQYLELTAVSDIVKNDRKQYPMEKLLEIINRDAPEHQIHEDILFHQEIINMSENRYISKSYATISPTLFILYSINVPMYQQEFNTSFYERHMKLFNALLNDDKQECIRKFQEHHEYALEKALFAITEIERQP